MPEAGWKMNHEGDTSYKYNRLLINSVCVNWQGINLKTQVKYLQQLSDCNDGQELQATLNILHWPLVPGFSDECDYTMPNQLACMAFFYVSQTKMWVSAWKVEDLIVLNS